MEPELEAHWNDGLRAALRLIDKKKDFKVKLKNIYSNQIYETADFILGWGGFNSPVDSWIRQQNITSDGKHIAPSGLCIGGNAFPPRQDDTYDVLFYETNWYKKQIEWHPNIRRAFGINDDIFHEEEWGGFEGSYPDKLYDYTSVGSFSKWKRHELITKKEGNKLVLGQIQRNNAVESMGIIARLLAHGVAVSDMVAPEKLALIYNLTDVVYCMSDINGGGERAVWEAISCGCKVEVADDNPKLQSLVKEEPVGYHWYASALLSGIKSCLK